jgi:hypothetical protein
MNWLNFDGEEWIYFGTGTDIELQQLEQIIFDFISSKKLYKVDTRTTSALLTQNEIKNVLPELLGRTNFVLWSNDQSRVIQFNQIGVMRKGILKSK